MEKITCCGCDFQGSDHGVRVHLAVEHPQIVTWAKTIFGRIPKDACPRCRMFHDWTPRPGWAVKRRKIERGRTVSFAGRGPKDQHAEEVFTLGTTKVPEGFSKISKILLWSTAQTKFLFSIRDEDSGQVRDYELEYTPPK
jgi:hypothetical protein